MPSPEEPRGLTRPAAQSGSRRPRLVGRSRELLVLRLQLAEALTGNGSVVVLGGEAGIGKSRLAETLGREAADSGALVLTGHCYDFAVTPPYGPWGELIEQYAAGTSQSPGRAAIPVPHLTHGASQSAQLSDIRDFFFAIARDRPLILILEDVHWADAESFELLRFIARQLSAVPIMLVITYRNNEITRAHPLYRLVPLLVREALAVRIDVSPLTKDNVRALIDDTYSLPGEDADRLATYLQRRAEGNPFFVVELLRALEGNVLLQGVEMGWSLGGLEQTRIPTLLRQVIDQRLSRLGPEVEALLEIAAIIGQVVPLDLWGKVSGIPAPALLDVVERACEANVMDPIPDGTGARFTHALIRDSLYDSVLPPRRRAWHLQIGEALAVSDAGADPDEVAYHLNQAGDRRAVEWLIRAGERAQRAFAWRTAAQRFESALALVEFDPTAQNELGWLRFRLALLRRFEQPVAGVALLETAERIGRSTNDQALVAYARFYQGMLRCQADDLRQGIAAEEAGIAMLDALSAGDRARLFAIDTTADPLDSQNGRGELTLALAENGRLQAARALGEQIVSLPESETTGSRGDAFYGLGYAYAALGLPEMARSAFGHAREIFVASDYRSMVTASLFDELVMVTLPYWVDRPDDRLRLEMELAESLGALHEISDPGSMRNAHLVSAVLTGSWNEAIDMLEQSSLRFMRRAVPMLLAPIARHRGNTELAWSLILQSFPAGPDTTFEDSALDLLPLRSLAAALAIDAGDLEMARRWLESLDGWLDWSGSVLGRTDAHLGWASYHRATHDNMTARERALQALAVARAPSQPIALLAANRLRGELDLAEARYPEAAERFEAACALAAAIGSQHELALTLLSQSELQQAQGHTSAARELLDTVREYCLPMKAALTLSKVDALELRMRVPSESSRSSVVAGLTPREIDVLRLLTTGLQNAEIAWQLCLSPRTIDTHLTSIYGKLGVTTRGAAIRVALDNGLS
jgi:predicted ATPase/DNA-binding CsgD family transcriptional regulator